MTRRHRLVKPRVASAMVMLLLLVFLLANTAAHAQGDAADKLLEVNRLDTTGAPAMTAEITAPLSSFGVNASELQFVVKENDEAIDVVVKSLEGRDLEVVLLIDTSGSMRGEAMESARDAALEFLEIIPPSVPVSVRGFGARADAPTEFTADRFALAAAIAALAPSGETALYDALAETAVAFGDRTSDRKVAVVVTDGGDTVSSVTAEEAIVALTAADVEINAVSLLTDESDPATLDRIVGERNGRVVSATDPVGLSEAYGEVAALLVNRYSLEWTTSNGGPTNVELALLAADGWHRFNARVVLPPLTTPTEAAVTPTPTEAPVAEFAPAAANLTLSPETTTGRLMIVGLTFTFVAILTATGSMILLPPANRRLADDFAAANIGTMSSRWGSDLSAPMRRFAEWVDRRFQRSSSYGRLSLKLDQAGVHTAAPEFAAMVVAACVVAFLSLGVFGAPLLGALLVGMIVLATWAVLSVRARNRKGAFAEQLHSTLIMIAGTLRAGYGVNQAVDTVAREGEEPTNEEFQRVLTEVRLGKSLPDGLRSAARRVDSEDFEWVVDAIEINNDVGGNLSEVLENVAGTLRARTTVQRKVQALSAEGRISAMVLYSLPFLMLFWIRITNPEYLAELTGSSAGRTMLIVAAVLLGIGGIWLKRIVTIDF